MLVDLSWLGHKHNSITDYSDPVMYIDARGEVKLKNRQFIQTPSYQKGRTLDDHNINFAERFYTHQALPGFGALDLTPHIENDNYVLNADLRTLINPYAKVGELASYKLQLVPKNRER